MGNVGPGNAGAQLVSYSGHYALEVIYHGEPDWPYSTTEH